MPIVKPVIFGGTFVSMEVKSIKMKCYQYILTVNPERMYLPSVVLVLIMHFVRFLRWSLGWQNNLLYIKERKAYKLCKTLDIILITLLG